MKKRILFLIISLFSISAFATDYYVETTGSNANTGLSKAAAWQTFPYAVANVPAGNHTIHLGTGNFTNTTRNTGAIGVSLEGAGAALTTITSTYVGSTWMDGTLVFESATLNTAGNQHVSGITFNGSNHTARTAIVIINRGNVTVYDCRFVNFLYGPAHFFGSAYESYTQPATWVTGNAFYNNTVTDCSSYGASNQGLWFQGQDGFLLHDCSITTTRATGVTGDMVSSKTNKNIKIYNMYVSRPGYILGKWAFAYELRWNFGGCEFYNNITEGCLDLCWNYSEGQAYSWWIHNSTFGYNSIPASMDIGIDIEANTDKLLIENVRIKYVCQGIMLSTSFPSSQITFSDVTMRNISIENIGVQATFSGISINGISIAPEFAGTYNTIVTNVNVVNNTLRGTTLSRCGIKVGNSGTHSNINLKNNIVTGFLTSPIDIYRHSDANALSISNLNIFNNDLYGNGNSNSISTTGNIVANPLTISGNITSNPLLNSDFTIPANSPCRNAGVDVGIPYRESAPDIGAFEYIPPAPVGTHLLKDANNVLLKDNNNNLLYY